MRNSLHWTTERRIKAQAAGTRLSDELMDDDSSDRPGAYAITANGVEGNTALDQWDPTDQTSPISSLRANSMRDESSKRYNEEEEEAESVSGGDVEAAAVVGGAAAERIKNKGAAVRVGSRKWCSEKKWLVLFGVFALLAVIAVVVVFVLLASNGKNGDGEVELTANSDNPCDFTGIPQPDPFLQCDCDKKISILTDDVRAKYESLVNFNLLQNHLLGAGDVTSCSAPNLALVWSAIEMSIRLETDGSGAALTYERVLQRFILANLYATTDGYKRWDRRANWLKLEENECVWFGVKCNSEGRVAEIDLAGNLLKGSIDTRIGLLPELKSLQLSLNQLKGTIPTEVWSLPLLEDLLLDDNQFSGDLPTTSLSPTLQRLSLTNNAVSGPFPSLSGLTNLEELDLSFTLLTGSFPSFSGLTSLQMINLSKISRADHTLQDDDWADMGQLQRLLMFHTPVEGTLPSSLSSLTNLKILDVGFTFVKGTLPDFIGDMVALEGIYAVDAFLSGPLPANVGQLTNLEDLMISYTQISGTIPPSFGNLTRLVAFVAANTGLNGALPTELNTFSDLELLDLGGCSGLSGTLPIGATKLQTISIGDTQISIPDGICDRLAPPQIVTSLECPCCEPVPLNDNEAVP